METNEKKSAATERAGEVASPTAGSVDTPEFIGRAIAAASEAVTVGPGEEWGGFVAHITALIEAARQEGYAAGRRNGARDEAIAQRAEKEEADQLATRTPVQAVGVDALEQIARLYESNENASTLQQAQLFYDARCIARSALNKGGSDE